MIADYTIADYTIADYTIADYALLLFLTISIHYDSLQLTTIDNDPLPTITKLFNDFSAAL
jgi:hypothetical protein